MSLTVTVSPVNQVYSMKICIQTSGHIGVWNCIYVFLRIKEKAMKLKIQALMNVLCSAFRLLSLRGKKIIDLYLLRSKVGIVALS